MISNPVKSGGEKNLLHCSEVKRSRFTSNKLFLVIAAVVVSAFSLTAADAPVFKNGDFTEKTSVGLPKFWRVVTKEVANVQLFDSGNGIAVKMMPQAKERMFLIQYPGKLTPGTRYRVSYDVKSAKNTPHRVYFDYRDEFGKLRCNDGSWNSTPAEWTEQSFTFLFPTKASGGYLVLNPDDNGEVEFRNVRFELAPDGNVLKNPDFTLRNIKKELKAWNMIAVKGTSMSAADKVLRVNTGENGKAALAVQWDIPLVPGQSYRISSEVRAKTPGAFRIYAEWRVPDPAKPKSKGRLGSTGGWWRKVGSNWQRDTFNINFPENGKTPYLILSGKDAGYVEFRNVKVEAIDKNAPAALTAPADVPAAKKVEKPAAAPAPAAAPVSADGNLLKNPAFTVNEKGKIADWNKISGTMENVDGALRLTTQNGKAALAAQWGINVEPGKSYKISAEVRAAAPGSYRIYSEWRIPDPANPKSKGRLSSYGGWWRSVDTKWKKDSIVVNIPENSHSAYLILSGKTAEYVEFRNVRIEETVSSIPPQARLSWGNWKISNTAAFSINKAGQAVLTITPDNGRNGVVTLTDVKIKPGQRYAFKYTIQGLGKANSDTGFHPFRILAKLPGVKDDGGAWDDTQNGIRTKNIEFTVPANVTGNKAEIKIETTTRGAVAFWGFELKELPPKAAELVRVRMLSPFFRDTFFPGNRESTIAGELFADTGKIKIALFDSKNKKIVDTAVVMKNGKGNFSIPAASLQAGNYKLQFSANVKGSDVLLERIISKLADRENYTGFDGKNFIVNGKIFLPVICWTIAGTSSDQSDEQIQRGFYHAAKNGMNSMIFRANDCEAALRYLNIAQKVGMKLFLATGNAPSGDPNTVALWEHKISGILTDEVIRHPALFGYFLVDEPYWRGIPSSGLIASYKVLKYIDPYHPVWINAAPRGSVEVHAEYSKAADIYGVDVYPVGSPGHSGLEDKGLSSIGKYVIRMNEACGGNKPIIMALQGFAWGVYSGRKALYPTFDELRFMTYDAITSGGIGVSYWGTQDIQDAKFYDNVLYPVTRELMQISGILAADEVAEVKSSVPAVHVFARKVGGKIYVIAANTGSTAVKATLSGVNNGKLTVVNENRSVSAADGKLTDDFAPYAVHIYAEGKLPGAVNYAPAADQSAEERGNPVFSFMREKLSRVPYDGKACWLWVKGLERVAFSKAFLCKEFTAEKEVKSARLIISADDTYEVWLNGEEADKNFPKSLLWNLADVIDVTKFVKKGNNTFTIAGADGGVVPCGVIADLLITFTDGTTMQVVTDGTWKANGTQIDNWQMPEVFNKWDNASIVAPYGSGAWSNKMMIKASGNLK